MVRPIAFGTVTRDALPDQIASRLIALIKLGEKIVSFLPAGKSK